MTIHRRGTHQVGARRGISGLDPEQLTAKPWKSGWPGTRAHPRASRPGASRPDSGKARGLDREGPPRLDNLLPRSAPKKFDVVV